MSAIAAERMVNIVQDKFIPGIIRVEFGDKYDTPQEERYVTVFHGPDAHQRARDYVNWCVHGEQRCPQ